MLSEADFNFAGEFQRSGLRALLTSNADVASAGAGERLLRRRAPIAAVLAERDISFTFEKGTPQEGAHVMPVRVGAEVCRLHLSPAMIQWLQQPLDFAGGVTDEDPPQQALLLEFASLDLLRRLETHLDQPIRFGEGSPADTLLSVSVRVVAEDETFVCRLDLAAPLAEALADGLDHLQPPELPDLSAVSVEVVLEAGSQELFQQELESLLPGDIVMLDSDKPSAVVKGKLAAPVAHQARGFALVRPFAPVGRRAASRPQPKTDDAEGQMVHPLRVGFEFGRVGMTLAEIDELASGDQLPFAQLDATMVDIVSREQRIGRGELVAIGEGTGVRIVHLSTASGTPGEQIS